MFRQTERSFGFEKAGEFFLFKEARPSGLVILSHTVNGIRCAKRVEIAAPSDLLLEDGRPCKKLLKSHLGRLNPLDVRVIGKLFDK